MSSAQLNALQALQQAQVQPGSPAAQAQAQARPIQQLTQAIQELTQANTQMAQNFQRVAQAQEQQNAMLVQISRSVGAQLAHQQAASEHLATCAQKMTMLEHRRSESQDNQKEALRHASQFFAGDLWALTRQAMPSLLQSVLQNSALGQGIFPVQADARRGVYQETLQWLRNRGQVSEEWYQGQVLLWLPEFQHMLLQTARQEQLAPPAGQQAPRDPPDLPAPRAPGPPDCGQGQEPHGLQAPVHRPG